MNDDLSVPQAAKELSVTSQTIWNMVERGELDKTREIEFGSQKRMFVSRASVDAAYERRTGQRRESNA